MSDAGGAFLKKSRKLLLQDFLPKIERAVSVLHDDDIWWRPNDASNSIGNLLLHLSGNVAMWIVGGVGSRPFERNRQQEFDERTHISATELLRRLRATLEQAFADKGVHLVVVPVDYSENERVLVEELRRRLPVSGAGAFRVSATTTSSSTKTRTMRWPRSRSRTASRPVPGRDTEAGG